MEADDDIHGAPVDSGDSVEHLWNAAHEMLRAFRTLIDAADEFVESQRGRPVERRAPGGRDAREGRVHHIDIDIDERDVDERDLDIDERPAATGLGAS